MKAILLLIIITVLLRFLDYLYYKDYEAILIICGLQPKNASHKIKISIHKKYDPLFAIIAFVWPWIDIFILAHIYYLLPNILTGILVVILTGACFRALQEVAHTATHNGLCASRQWQWLLANLFFQYPCFKMAISKKFKSHVIDHHQHPNIQAYDPNLQRFAKYKFTPTLSKMAFYRKLFHSFSFSGLAETLATMAKSLWAHESFFSRIFRLITLTIIISSIWLLYGIIGLLLSFVIPLVFIYPWFSWISTLAEHRWYIQCHKINRREREYVVGRPTDYKGLSGYLIKKLIFPRTDSYHLVHSLYPLIRWNYMAVIDQKLKVADPCYMQHSSIGLWFKDRKSGKHSALSELYETMTN